MLVKRTDFFKCPKYETGIFTACLYNGERKISCYMKGGRNTKNGKTTKNSRRV